MTAVAPPETEQTTELRSRRPRGPHIDLSTPGVLQAAFDANSDSLPGRVRRRLRDLAAAYKPFDEPSGHPRIIRNTRDGGDIFAAPWSDNRVIPKYVAKTIAQPVLPPTPANRPPMQLTVPVQTSRPPIMMPGVGNAATAASKHRSTGRTSRLQPADAIITAYRAANKSAASEQKQNTIHEISGITGHVQAERTYTTRVTARPTLRSFLHRVADTARNVMRADQTTPSLYNHLKTYLTQPIPTPTVGETIKRFAQQFVHKPVARAQPAKHIHAIYDVSEAVTERDSRFADARLQRANAQAHSERQRSLEATFAHYSVDRALAQAAERAMAAAQQNGHALRAQALQTIFADYNESHALERAAHRVMADANAEVYRARSHSLTQTFAAHNSEQALALAAERISEELAAQKHATREAELADVFSQTRVYSRNGRSHSRFTKFQERLTVALDAYYGTTGTDTDVITAVADAAGVSERTATKYIQNHALIKSVQNRLADNPNTPIVGYDKTRSQHISDKIAYVSGYSKSSVNRHLNYLNGVGR